MEKKPTIKMNPTRELILATLKNAERPLTLAEISAQIGVEVKTGTTNAMVKAGLMQKVGVREIRCEVCGHTHKVAEYTIGE